MLILEDTEEAREEKSWKSTKGENLQLKRFSIKIEIVEATTTILLNLFHTKARSELSTTSKMWFKIINILESFGFSRNNSNAFIMQF